MITRRDPALAATRIDQAGKKGWRCADGSIIWDNGTKEVPVSGMNDDDKRRQAYAEAAGLVTPQREGVNLREVAELETMARPLAEPEKVLKERRIAAKEAARRKPAPDAPPVIAVPSLEQQEGNVKRRAYLLLDTEMSRLDELKELAIAGHVELRVDDIVVRGANPPMQLHEVLVRAVRLQQEGTPQQMLEILREMMRWNGATPAPADTLPYPPSGEPFTPFDPPVNPLDIAHPGTGEKGTGGQPTIPPAIEPARTATQKRVDG